ncbi:Dolichyl-diphosphooligosaccharide--protein glycosyltransferase subunit 2 [Zea mays]|uniref:Dolichyl-diphosphooligosaccharide--protein glycosyltransferase subunit 2 n=1 Tax=Zea mays TaxID=4577 RepID=A0A1D6G6E7_MAIZE|nr:Dolichyl-diphosphooligosaccharide--protein glycosyltransferase subunit 2 [Zea mays]AQK98771.1 Dolichyl-diphosphooligosaccharide--protein glycosyltransferase subunit 2 [Zea mays]
MAGRRPAPAALLLLAVAFAPISSAVRPVSDAHRSAAEELFAPSADGSFGDLESTYEAVKTFQILGLEKYNSLSGKACKFAAENLASTDSTAKDLFHAVRISGALGCGVDAGVYDGVVARLKAVIKDTNSLLEFYYSVGGLLSIKEQGHNVVLPDAESTFHAIKALSQSDGRWRYGTNSAESSTFAAGIALEALAGVVSLADAEVDPSMMVVVRNDIVKLFDTIKSYDDGTFYFDEKHVDATEYKGPIMTSASVVRGVTSFAAVASGKLDIPGDKILGLAKFFLGIGLPGSSKDCFNQIDSLVFVPLILSLPTKVFSLSLKDQLKVEVTTVFGSAAPLLKVNLVQVLGTDSKVITNGNRELQYDLDKNVHYLDIAPLEIDVGKYSVVFEAEIGISDNDAGTVESVQKLDLLKDTKVSLSANHLQKLRLSFQLTTPLGLTFKPHQVFLKLKHESKVEHLFVVPGSARQFKIVLDFLGLVEKFYYLSGRYDLELAVGDAAMENSFLRPLGHLELDLPEAPEKAPRPPAQAVDPFSKFGPKAEILHIFRAPEKRPPKELSLAFTGLTLLPFIGFLIGLVRLGVNVKNFPSLPGPAAFASVFHAGIGAVLLLYVLFWLKLDLFTTLKYLGFLGIFLVFVGHRTLSYLSSASAKQKTA